MEELKGSFLKTYDENADALFRHCFFKVNDREIAIDLLQDTFTKTWEYLSNGNSVTNLRAFLYKILNNLIIDYYRKKKQVSLEYLIEEGFEPSDEPLDFHRLAEGEKAKNLINKLPEPYRQAVFLRYINELEISEISEITGESENTVSVHVHRGINKLRELYEE